MGRKRDKGNETKCDNGQTSIHSDKRHIHVGGDLWYHWNRILLYIYKSAWQKLKKDGKSSYFTDKKCKNRRERLLSRLQFKFYVFFLFPNWTHLPFETSPGTGDKSLACLSLSLPHSGTIRLNYYLLLLITYYWTIIICTHLKPVCTLRYRSTYVWCSLIILPFQFKEAYRRSNMFFRVNVCA